MMAVRTFIGIRTHNLISAQVSAGLAYRCRIIEHVNCLNDKTAKLIKHKTGKQYLCMCEAANSMDEMHRHALNVTISVTRKNCQMSIKVAQK